MARSLDELDVLVRQLQGIVARISPATPQAYGTLSYATSRDLNAGTVTTTQLANVVGTLIDDLTKLGIIGPHS